MSDQATPVTCLGCRVHAVCLRVGLGEYGTRLQKEPAVGERHRLLF